MKKRALLAALCLGLAACAPEQPTLPINPEEIARFPLNSLSELASSEEVTIDTEVTTDGVGSARVDATEPTSVTLLEVTDLDAQNATLTFEARLRSQDLEGNAHIEMEVFLPEQEEPVSLPGLGRMASGTTEWVVATSSFYFQPGQQPEAVRLKLVVDGAGTVWVDEVRLLRTPLPRQRP
ncbi:MAG: hypothetical protein ACRD4D_06255 [Candidatus Acidiferrales bacterium]